MSDTLCRPVAASSDLITRLQNIWTRTLRISALAPDDNFFDLGGDSLLAVNLFLEIERETGLTLPITAIYDAPTIAELAALIESETAPSPSPLVLLKQGKHGTPLYIVHGIGGTVMELQNLGRNIRIPGPVYGVQARGLDGREAPLTSVHDMADHYLAAIREIQPYGPYWLGGYSFGGLVALEMARRLRTDRETIALLLLLDAYAHPSTWPLASRARMRARRALHHLRLATREPFRLGAPILQTAMRGARARLFGMENRRTTRLREWLQEQNPDLPLPLLRVREAGSAALAAYVPRFYAGRVTFLRAAEPDRDFPDDARRIWEKLAPDLTIRTAPGSHRSLVTLHADGLAAAITSCILDAICPRAFQSAPPALRANPPPEPRLEPSPA